MKPGCPPGFAFFRRHNITMSLHGQETALHSAVVFFLVARRRRNAFRSSRCWRWWSVTSRARSFF